MREESLLLSRIHTYGTKQSMREAKLVGEPSVYKAHNTNKGWHNLQTNNQAKNVNN
jgi:hypothetical protein